LLYNGDSFDALRVLCEAGLKLPFLFADPPDNLGLAYDNMVDKVDPKVYKLGLTSLFFHGIQAKIFWLSYYHAYDPVIMRHVADGVDSYGLNWKKILWRFTFGQHRDTDFGSGHRPILRLLGPGVDVSSYVSKIRVRSARQELGDSRANPEGRVPDDVWDFPRVVGNAAERRTWHPTQHPEALLERIVLSSGGESLKLVTDAFAGTGSLLRVAERLNLAALGFEQSAYYCKMIAMSLPNLVVTTDLKKVIEFVKTTTNY
jgi:site-specific DNA-methyltransferase (adenine-specific)